MFEKPTFTGHNKRPATCKSRSTSCEGGASPSALDARGSSNKEDATARTAAHDKIDLYRRRHDHSALLRNTMGFRLCQSAQETNRFRRPSTADLHPQNHEA